MFQIQSEGWQTQEEGEEDEYYIDDSVFVSEPQPRSAAQCEKDALREGTLHTELKELYKKFRKNTKPRVEVANDVVGGNSAFLCFHQTYKKL